VRRLLDMFAAWMERRPTPEAWKGEISPTEHWEGRCRVIMDHVNPGCEYLRRYYLIGGPNHRRWCICIHKIMRSDRDHCHDHPFAFVSLILAGKYFEELPSGGEYRTAGSLRVRGARSLHRLVALTRSVWTLFMMGPRTRNWGFRVDGKWIPHQTHLQESQP
jgi:hypothetical protein